MADYDHHGRLARLLWEQQLAGPPAQADRTPSNPVAVAGTLVRERYLRAEEFLIGLIGVALLRLSAANGLSAADRTRLAGPLVEQLQAFLWQLDGVPFSQGWEVLALLDNLPPGPILDAACGTGRYAAHLAGQGRQVVGVDIAAEMLAIAQARVPTGHFVDGDLRALPLPTASMAATVSGLPSPTSATWRRPRGNSPGSSAPVDVSCCQCRTRWWSPCWTSRRPSYQADQANPALTSASTPTR